MAKQEHGFLNVLFISLGVALLAVACANIEASSITGSRASTKPYTNFSSFYQFYLTEHTDLTNRRLHLVGTTLIVVLVLFFSPLTLLPMVIAASTGSIVCGLLAGIEHGFFEFAIMLLVYLASHRLITGNLQFAVLVPVLAYGFAWVGHFYFERNKPASFIYPTFSLMGDFRMWAECWMGIQYGIFK